MSETVYVDWSCPDDGTDNYDRDIRIEVVCHPGSKGHTDPHYDCAGCPPEPAEFEIIGAVYLDDKKPLSEKTMDALFADKKYVNRIEEMASEIFSEKEDEDPDDIRDRKWGAEII